MGNLVLNVPYLTHEHLLAGRREPPARSVNGGKDSRLIPLSLWSCGNPRWGVSPGNKQGGPGVDTQDRPACSQHRVPASLLVDVGA